MMVRRRLEEATDDTDFINPDNVIPFRPPRDVATASFDIDVARRPAPDFLAPRGWRKWPVAFFAGSLLAHAGVAAFFFLHAPGPVAGIGLEAISVEVVFGADAPAGVAPTPNEQDTQLLPSTSEEAVAKQDAVEQEPRPETAPVVPPPDPEALERQDIKEDKKQSQKEVAPPSSVASGFGRGQARGNAEYGGQVMSHLARQKRAFPREARNKRNQGTAEVGFRLDSTGRVIAVKLLRSSGVSAFDQEAQAMVWRASPFPPPPAGADTEYTFPLSFQLR
jgi:TonB family protein